MEGKRVREVEENGEYGEGWREERVGGWCTREKRRIV